MKVFGSIVLVMVGLAIGCDKAKEEAKKVKESVEAKLPDFGDTVTKVKSGSEEILAALQKGDFDAAHHSMHGLLTQAKALVKIIPTLGLQGSDADEAKSAADTLVSSFTEIDKQIHDQDKEADNTERVSAVSQAIATLEGIVKKIAGGASDENASS